MRTISGIRSANAKAGPRTSATTAATIESIGDQDYFKVSLQAGKQYTFRTVAGTLLKTRSMTLIGTNGITELASNDNALPLKQFGNQVHSRRRRGLTSCESAPARRSPLATGTYELQVLRQCRLLQSWLRRPMGITPPIPRPSIWIPVFGVTDADTANFARGRLTVKITSNATIFDRLEIVNQGTGAGLISVAGSKISYGGVPIGSVLGGSSDKTFYFNGNATLEAVEALDAESHLPHHRFRPQHRPQNGSDPVVRRGRRQEQHHRQEYRHRDPLLQPCRNRLGLCRRRLTEL
jgi:hypothetical protein